MGGGGGDRDELDTGGTVPPAHREHTWLAVLSKQVLVCQRSQVAQQVIAATRIRLARHCWQEREGAAVPLLQACCCCVRMHCGSTVCCGPCVLGLLQQRLVAAHRGAVGAAKGGVARHNLAAVRRRGARRQ
jgi:hypothetical protein